VVTTEICVHHDVPGADNFQCRNLVEHIIHWSQTRAINEDARPTALISSNMADTALTGVVAHDGGSGPVIPSHRSNRAQKALQAARIIPVAREMIDTGFIILEISCDLIFSAQKCF